MARRPGRIGPGKMNTDVEGRALAGLSKITKGGDPITSGLLRHWATDQPEREAFLASTAWGSVQWLKSLGKPLGPSLSSGFIIHHQVISEFNVPGQGRDGEPAKQISTVDLPTPSAWDVPED